MPTNPQGPSRSPQGAGQRQGEQQSGQQNAHDTVDRVAKSAQSTFANARQKVTDQISSVVRAVERASDELNKQEQPGLANRVQQFARRAESASTYLQDKSPQELKSDLDDLARRKPAWVLGGAFVAGLAAARFLKSSEKSSERNRLAASRIPGVGAGSSRGGSYGAR